MKHWLWILVVAIWPTTEPTAEPTAEPDVIPRFMRPRERPWWMQVGFGNRPPEPPVVESDQY